MIMIPKISENMTPHQLEALLDKWKLQPRGAGGEHTPAGPGGKWDISNKQRIGFSEVELVQKMIDGVDKLITIEQNLEKGMPLIKSLGEHSDCLNH
jgi:creatine kinase